MAPRLACPIFESHIAPSLPYYSSPSTLVVTRSRNNISKPQQIVYYLAKLDLIVTPTNSKHAQKHANGDMQ